MYAWIGLYICIHAYNYIETIITRRTFYAPSHSDHRYFYKHIFNACKRNCFQLRCEWTPCSGTTYYVASTGHCSGLSTSLIFSHTQNTLHCQVDCIVSLFVHAKWRMLMNVRVPMFPTLNYMLAQKDIVFIDRTVAFINTKLCVACFKVRFGLFWPPGDCGKKKKSHSCGKSENSMYVDLCKVRKVKLSLLQAAEAYRVVRC
jgi:hypothetical protein